MNTEYGEQPRFVCWEGVYIPDLTQEDTLERLEQREELRTNKRAPEEIPGLQNEINYR